eukprot:TRINITY_DN11216_c0_g1_i1.p1 TRINITY_DN11216_c0_g1~~TRINITY_DN11216_c0_g1_i1.p1  ORF type:complete len:734 (-),score=126.01 TRINITY_DN11216_c0_g1_i1:44-2245(-)
MEGDDVDDGWGGPSASAKPRSSTRSMASTFSMTSTPSGRGRRVGRDSAHTVCTVLSEDCDHAVSKGPVSKILQDEQNKMEEKRKAYELKQARQYMEEVTGGHKWRLNADSIMEHGAYQTAMTVCTFISVGLVARDADYHAAGLERTDTMNVVDAVLIGVFALDIVAKIYVWQSKFATNVMNVFELVLLLLDLVLQYWPNLPRIAAAMKIMRFVRMMRLMRSLSAFRELYLMMMGIAASVRSIVFGAGLLFVTLTIFGVLAVYFVRPVCRDLYEAGVFGDCEDCKTSFDTVMESNLTFFKTIIAGDSWGRLACPIIHNSAIAGSVLLGAWMVIYLGLLNTIAAVIVDRQALARVKDADYTATMQAEEMNMSMNALMILFRDIDAEGDNSGTISMDELLSAYDASPHFRSLLNRMDVHRQHLPVLFNIMDTDDTDDLTFAEFVHGLHNLKNENAHTLAIFTRHYCESMLDKIYELEDLHVVMKQQDRRLGRLAGNVEVLLTKFKGAGDREDKNTDEEEDSNRRAIQIVCPNDRLSQISQTLDSLRSQLSGPYARQSLGEMDCQGPATPSWLSTSENAPEEAENPCDMLQFSSRLRASYCSGSLSESSTHVPPLETTCEGGSIVGRASTKQLHKALACHGGLSDSTEGSSSTAAPAAGGRSSSGAAAAASPASVKQGAQHAQSSANCFSPMDFDAEGVKFDTRSCGRLVRLKRPLSRASAEAKMVSSQVALGEAAP